MTEKRLEKRAKLGGEGEGGLKPMRKRELKCGGFGVRIMIRSQQKEEDKSVH